MNSSTSSSRRFRAFLRDRTARTLLLSAVLILLTGAVLSGQHDPMAKAKVDQDRFWAAKTHLRNGTCDVVILGDSRAYRGISPEAMREILPDRVIGNFGYSSGGLNPVMYQAAENWLNPKSDSKTIVLAVTPWSLTRKAALNSQYLEEKRRPLSEVVERIYVEPLAMFFSPVGKQRLAQLLGGNPPENPATCEEFHDDGWVKTEVLQADPQKELAVYRKGFRTTNVDPTLCRELINQVRNWSSRGVRVVGVRIPTNREMLALEDLLSGFDDELFAQDFVAAGGIWLSFSPDDYHSYDGSHLDADSAIAFSHNLAVEMSRNCRSQPAQTARRTSTKRNR